MAPYATFESPRGRPWTGTWCSPAVWARGSGYLEPLFSHFRALKGLKRPLKSLLFTSFQAYKSIKVMRRRAFRAVLLCGGQWEGSVAVPNGLSGGHFASLLSGFYCQEELLEVPNPLRTWPRPFMSTFFYASKQGQASNGLCALCGDAARPLEH